MMTYLQFENEAAGREALAPWTVNDVLPAYIGSAAVDVVGTILRPTGNVIHAPDGVVPELAPVPGWHINLSEQVPELQGYEIEAPTTPDRVFAGTDVVHAPRVPAKVTRRQARQALALAGLLDKVQPAINAIADPVQQQMAQIEWDDSQEFERDRPLLIQLGHDIGLDNAALDAMFIQAGEL